MRKVAEFGPNGDRGDVYTVQDLIAFLEEGGEVRLGAFSGETGYSGWWDACYLDEGGKLILITDQTDTSHYDPERVEVLEAPWEAIKALIKEAPPGEDPGEALYAALEKGRDLFRSIQASGMKDGSFELE